MRSSGLHFLLQRRSALRRVQVSNPNTSLQERTKAKRYNRVKELNIGGRSSMNKQALVDAIRQRT